MKFLYANILFLFLFSSCRVRYYVPCSVPNGNHYVKKGLFAPKYYPFSAQTIQQIEKNFVPVDVDIYACKYETNLSIYDEFLSDLNQKKDTASFRIAKQDTSYLYSLSLIHFTTLFRFYNTQKGFGDYPVVNISHQGALLFCDWLSEKYNKNPKRKFKQVKFKLPTEEEWLSSAYAGDSDKSFVWKENSVLDEKGYPRASFSFGRGGSFFTEMFCNYEISPVNSFKPNEFGIHNLCGNAAEMLEEFGKIKGGSWHDYPDLLLLRAKQDPKQETKRASPFIGFRVFMKIIEK